MDMQHGDIDMEHRHEAWTCNIDMQNEHAKWICMILSRMDVCSNGHTAWTCRMYKHHGRAALHLLIFFIVFMFMFVFIFMQHVHAA